MVEIVIKIPYKEYKDIKDFRTIVDESRDFIADCILKGTILPKGHGRLIDADKIRIVRSSDNMIEPNIEIALQAVQHYMDQLQTIVESDNKK